MPLLGHDDDRGVGLHHLAHVLGETTRETDVDGTAKVAEGERPVVARVDHDGTLFLVREHRVGIEHGNRRLLVEQFVRTLVLLRGEEEVERRHGLALGDGIDEVVDVHGGERVVGPALLADRGRSLRGQVLAACRPRAVGGEHAGRVRQSQQLPVERGVQLAGETVSSETNGPEQVGPSDVADEQRVTCEHPIRQAAPVVDHDADGLWRVARGLHDLEHDLPELDGVAVADGDDVVSHTALRRVAVDDDGPGLRRELEMAGEEVGVEVRLDDVGDREALLVRISDIPGDVALRVNHDGLPRGRVADEIAGVGEALEVVLLEDHRCSFGVTMIP